MKRAIDASVAATALILASPLCLLIAIVVKLTSRGPVFFVQERVGKDGRPFHILKFRTMRHGTHEEIVSSQFQLRLYASNDFKLPANDPRITRVGRLLRASSLDELPQFLNVFVGDMSLVGIRPLLAMELARRSEYDQSCYRAMRPGLTGLWQVEGRSVLDPVDRQALDREYVETWSSGRDVSILVRTPAAILRFHHAA